MTRIEFIKRWIAAWDVGGDPRETGEILVEALGLVDEPIMQRDLKPENIREPADLARGVSEARLLVANRVLMGERDAAQAELAKTSMELSNAKARIAEFEAKPGAPGALAVAVLAWKHAREEYVARDGDDYGAVVAARDEMLRLAQNSGVPMTGMPDFSKDTPAVRIARVMWLLKPVDDEGNDLSPPLITREQALELLDFPTLR